MSSTAHLVRAAIRGADPDEPPTARPTADRSTTSSAAASGPSRPDDPDRMDADDVAGHLGDLGGAARTGDLRKRGVPRRALDAARARGLVLRPSRGCYALPGVGPGVLAAVRVDGALTCVSALDGYQLPLRGRPDGHHVLIATSRGAPRPGLLPQGTRLHWGTASHRGIVVAPADALAHAARCLPVPDLVAAMDAALARRLVDLVDLSSARTRAAGATFDRALRLADARSGSFQESVVRVALVESGLRVDPQVAVPGVGRVDLLVESRVVVETDGFAYHADRQAFREDRRRDRRLELDGHPVLRYAYEDAVFGLGGLVEEVHRLVSLTARAGARRAERAGERAAGSMNR